jgi:hypothetical protein
VVGELGTVKSYRSNENRKRVRLLMVYVIRWDEKAGLRRDAVRSQGIDALEAQDKT